VHKWREYKNWGDDEKQYRNAFHARYLRWGIISIIIELKAHVKREIGRYGARVLRQFGVAVLQCCGHAVKQRIKS
jgi:hypothetical protein